MKASIIVAFLAVVVASTLSDTPRYSTVQPELVPNGTVIRGLDSIHEGPERICDTLYYHNGGVAYYWRFPSRWGHQQYAIRFDIGPSMACTLKTARVAMYGPAMIGTPDLRVYMWDDTAICCDRLPNNKLDSVDIPYEELDTVGVQWLWVRFSQGYRVFKNESFHISCGMIGSPGESLGLLADNWLALSRCSWMWGENHWEEIILNDDLWPDGPGFLIEAIVCCYSTCCNHDGIRGDANDDNSIDVADVTFLVDYLFNDALAPVCDEESDANASGDTDISDLTRLVDYLFNDGPPPEPCP